MDINKLLLKLTRISFVERLFFLDNLRTMLHASLSLVESFSILEKEMVNKKFKQITGEIKSSIEQGQTLSEVLAKYPKAFPPIYVKMISAGEMSGKLEESLQQIVNQMKKSHALTASIQGAMIYPAVILTAMGGVGIFMSVFVLPKLVDIFKEFNAELPLATRILIGFVHFVSNPLYLASMVISLGLIIFLFLYFLKNNLSFRRFLHSSFLRLPIAGRIIRKINLARFSFTLSSLLKSTIPIVEAASITADTCGNVLYQEALHGASTQLKSGRPLSEILAEKGKLFPPMVTEMIMVGERAGEVERLTEELAVYFSDEVDATMKNFTVIIEPVIIIILGIAVAGVAVAVVMPMYTLVQNF